MGKSKTTDRSSKPPSSVVVAVPPPSTTLQLSSSSSSVSPQILPDVVTDVMEQTLTTTSKLIAGWMRTTSGTVDFSWLHDYCSEPSKEQPEVIYVHHPVPKVPVNDTSSGRDRFDDLLSLPTLDASSASSETPSVQCTSHRNTHITSTNNKPRYKYDFSNEQTTTGPLRTKNYGLNNSIRNSQHSHDDNTSCRSERTDYTGTTYGTDLQSIHSFLMVSHAAPKKQYTSYMKQQQLLPHHHSHHSRVISTPIRDHARLPRCTTPISDPTSLPDDDPNDFFILTPSWMQKLQRSFPMLKRGDSFWLQYSLIRDGASLDTMLEKTETIQHCVLAIETVEGEVLGAFLAQPLQRSHQWSGSAESFLWRVCVEENDKDHVVKDNYGKKCSHHYKDDRKTKIDVYKFSFLNPYVQLCHTDRLLIGSGDDGDHGDDGVAARHHDIYQGFGIALEKDLLTGTSQPCRTFSSPSLSRYHSDGSSFEVRNVEVWNLRPCLSMVEGNGRRVVHRRKSTRRRRS